VITFDLLFKFRFTVVMLSSYNAWLPVYSRPKHRVAYVCAKFYAQVVRLQCRRKKFTFAISSPDELLVISVG